MNYSVGEITCPVCSSLKNKLLYFFNARDSAKHVVSINDDKFEQIRQCVINLWGKETCATLTCQSCGLIFSHPFLSGDSKFYSLLYSDSSEYHHRRWEFTKTIEVLESLKNREMNLLEIGAGNGAFIKMVSDKIINKENIVCTEYSDYSCSEIASLGVKCYCSPIDYSLIKDEKKFDIICMFQVLEHLDHLDSFFSTLNSISSENALLFIGVPNNKLRDLYDSAGIRLDVPPIHLTRWNYNCMEYMANMNGWSVYDHKFEPDSVFNNIYHFAISYYQRKLKSSYKIDQISISYLRKALKLFTLLLILIKYFYLLPQLIKKNLGSSQWFYIRKKVSVKN